MNIQEIRQKYPQYNNVDDNTLAQGLYNKYYKDRLSFDDFKGRIGLSQPTQQPIQQSIYTQDDQMVLDPTQDTSPLTSDADKFKQQARQISRSFDREIYGLPVVGGLYKGVQDIASGGSQLLARGADALLGTDMAGDVDRTIKDQEQAYQQANAGKPLQDVARLAGGFVGGGGTSTGGALSRVATGGLLSRVATDAVVGGATSPVIMDDNTDFATQKAIQTGIGLATGGVLEGGARALSSGVSEAIQPLAKKAREFGIDLRMDQIKPSRVAKTAQKISQNIPFSGVDAQEALQRTQWNKAVAKTLGEGIEDLTPKSMQKFLKQNSQKYDSVLKNTKINIMPDDVTQLYDQVNFIKDNVSPIQFNKINKTLKTVIGDFEKGLDDVDFKMVSARKINGLKRDLLDLASKSQGDAKNIISETADFVQDTLLKSLPENKIKLLSQANREYRNFKTLEPLLEKATQGEINPTQLINRVGSSKYIRSLDAEVGQDDLVDLARIGKEFLPKAGGSDTFEKSATAGLTGASVLSPATLATVSGGALANRGAQALNRSQKLVDRAIQGVDVNVPAGLPEGLTRGISSELQGNQTQDNYKDKIQNRKDMIESIRGRISGQTQGTQPSPERLKLIQNLRSKIGQQSSIQQSQGNNFNTVMEDIFKEEGGYVANDAGAGPTKFGINKRANPDIDVKNLTKEKASNIYKKRYWDKIKGDDLSPAMQIIAMDAAVNQGVGWTRTALRKAKGDINKFAELRKKRYKNIAKNPTKRQYLTAWLNRVDRTKEKALQYV